MTGRKSETEPAPASTSTVWRPVCPRRGITASYNAVERSPLRTISVRPRASRSPRSPSVWAARRRRSRRTSTTRLMLTKDLRIARRSDSSGRLLVMHGRRSASDSSALTATARGRRSRLPDLSESGHEGCLVDDCPDGWFAREAAASGARDGPRGSAAGWWIQGIVACRRLSRIRKSARDCTVADRRGQCLCRARCKANWAGASASSPMQEAALARVASVAFRVKVLAQ